MDVIGLDEWNIKMFDTDNVLEAVIDRYNRLIELAAFKEKARSRWDDMDTIMMNTFKSFASDVYEYKSQAI